MEMQVIKYMWLVMLYRIKYFMSILYVCVYTCV